MAKVKRGNGEGRIKPRGNKDDEKREQIECGAAGIADEFGGRRVTGSELVTKNI